jgi:hypothetical protein
MWLLLLVPFVGLLWVPFYNFLEPALFDFPFFYWYQLAWVPVSAVSVLVRGLYVLGDCDRRAGAGRDHEHRCGQPVHPQCLEILCRSRYQPRRRGGGRKNCLAGGQVRRAHFHAVPAGAICARFAAARWLVDLQTFPALVFGLFTRWFRAEGLLLGWAAGILWGSWTAWDNGLKPLATIDLGGARYVFYVGLGALIINIAVAVIATTVVGLISPDRSRAAVRP